MGKGKGVIYLHQLASGTAPNTEGRNHLYEGGKLCMELGLRRAAEKAVNKQAEGTVCACVGSPEATWGRRGQCRQLLVSYLSISTFTLMTFQTIDGINDFLTSLC